MKKNSEALRSLVMIMILTSVPGIILYGQNYYLTFSGAGSGSSVSTVKIENINKGTDVTINGNDILHLIPATTRIAQIPDNNPAGISFYPNPVSDNSRMQFNLSAPGSTVVTIMDITGREIARRKDILTEGIHTYRIEGPGRGIYYVKVNSGNYSAGGRLVSNGSQNDRINLVYENTAPAITGGKKPDDSKGEVVMGYSEGDRLKFTGMTESAGTVITEIITSDKTIKFDFFPCTDKDNNVYPAVKIGDQIWMSTNLKTTKYNDGTAIPYVTDDYTWYQQREPAFCWYLHNEAQYKNLCGGIYNYYVASSGNICPTGWRVPSYNDWRDLEQYLIANGYNYDGTTSDNKIGKSLAATAMIALVLLPSVPFTWEPSPNTGTPGNSDYPIKRNSTGFSALPVGYRSANGNFMNFYITGPWWSSTEKEMGFAWYRWVQNANEGLTTGSSYKWNGFGIRCIKN